MCCAEGKYFRGVDDDGGFDLFVWVICMCDECMGGL